jgi:hypothetical protein
MRTSIVSAVALALTTGFAIPCFAGPAAGQPQFATRVVAVLAQRLDERQPYALTGSGTEGQPTWRRQPQRAGTTSQKRPTSFVFKRVDAQS